MATIPRVLLRRTNEAPPIYPFMTQSGLACQNAKDAS